jgi:sn-glycerol 3-phosphate transport system substrate-binding protein
MYRRLILATMVALLAFGSASAADNRPAARTPDGKIKLSLWFALSGVNGDAFKAQVEAFNKSQDKIVAEPIYSGSYADTATKIVPAIEAKTQPNVALMAAGPLYTGGYDDWAILDYINSDREFNKDDIFAGMWEYSTFDGKVCAVPYNISTPVLFFNRDILSAAGLDAAKTPVSWNDLFAMAQKAQAGGNKNKSDDFWGFDASDAPWLFKAMLAQNGNPVVETRQKTTTIPVYDRADAVEAASFWKKLVDEKLMPPAQHANAEKRFLAGNLAFIVASSSRIARWTTDAKFNLGAYALPKFKKSSVPLGGGGLVLFDKGKEANDASWQLVKFLMKAENQATFAMATGYVPVRKSSMEVPAVKAVANNPLYKVALAQLADSWAYWHFNEMGTMDLLIGQALERLEKGKQSPAEAMKSSVTELKNEMK